MGKRHFGVAFDWPRKNLAQQSRNQKSGGGETETGRRGEKYPTVRQAHRRQDSTGSLKIVYSVNLVANLVPNLVDPTTLNTNMLHSKPRFLDVFSGTLRRGC